MSCIIEKANKVLKVLNAGKYKKDPAAMKAAEEIRGMIAAKEEGTTDANNSTYSKLGSKTATGNVVLKSVYGKAGIAHAKNIGGVFSMRVQNSDKHFGNPFSSVIDKGLIATKSTKESVEKYIDWVQNSTEDRAKWIRGVLDSGKLKGKPVVYYKELGEPSHATALDYMINNWDAKEGSAKANGRQNAKVTKTMKQEVLDANWVMQRDRLSESIKEVTGVGIYEDPQLTLDLVEETLTGTKVAQVEAYYIPEINRITVRSRLDDVAGSQKKIKGAPLDMVVDEVVRSSFPDESRSEADDRTKGILKELHEMYGSDEGLLAHELIHAATTNYMKANPNAEATKRLHKLFKEVKKEADKQGAFTAWNANSRYWKEDVYEFIAEGLTNKKIAGALLNTKVEGYGGRLVNAWSEFMETLISMVGLSKPKMDTAYEVMLDSVVSMLEAQAERSGSYGAKQRILDALGGPITFEGNEVMNQANSTKGKFDKELDEKLREILQELYPEINLEYTEDEIKYVDADGGVMHQEEYDRLDVKEVTQGNTTKYNVYENGESIAQVVTRFRKRTGVHVNKVDVVKNYRGRGLASRLLSEVIQRNSAYPMSLDAYDQEGDKTARLVDWYSTFGFKSPTGETYSAEEDNAVHMERSPGILNQKQEQGKIKGQADIEAKTVLINSLLQSQDTLPHEYAHQYIAMFRDAPLVQEAIKKWGSEEALVQAIGEQVVKQKGEAYGWWKKFGNWLQKLFDAFSTQDKEELRNLLTDAFLTRRDISKDIDVSSVEKKMMLKNIEEHKDTDAIKDAIRIAGGKQELMNKANTPRSTDVGSYDELRIQSKERMENNYLYSIVTKLKNTRTSFEKESFQDRYKDKIVKLKETKPKVEKILRDYDKDRKNIGKYTIEKEKDSSKYYKYNIVSYNGTKIKGVESIESGEGNINDYIDNLLRDEKNIAHNKRRDSLKSLLYYSDYGDFKGDLIQAAEAVIKEETYDVNQDTENNVKILKEMTIKEIEEVTGVNRENSYDYDKEINSAVEHLIGNSTDSENMIINAKVKSKIDENLVKKYADRLSRDTIESIVETYKQVDIHTYENEVKLPKNSAADVGTLDEYTQYISENYSHVLNHYSDTVFDEYDKKQSSRHKSLGSFLYLTDRQGYNWKQYVTNSMYHQADTAYKMTFAVAGKNILKTKDDLIRLRLKENVENTPTDRYDDESTFFGDPEYYDDMQKFVDAGYDVVVDEYNGNWSEVVVLDAGTIRLGSDKDIKMFKEWKKSQQLEPKVNKADIKGLDGILDSIKTPCKD